MGQRNDSLSSLSKRIQRPTNYQKEICNRQKYIKSNDQQGSRDPEKHKESVRKINSFHTVRPSQEDYNSIHDESSTPNNTGRYNGNGTKHQTSRPYDCMGSGHQTAKPDTNHKDPVGRVTTSRIYRLGNIGFFLHQDIHSTPGTLLQMSEVQPHVKHLSCEANHLWPLRGSSSDQSLCGQEKGQRNHCTEVPQLQRRALDCERKMPISQRSHSKNETSSTCYTSDSGRTSQVGMGQETSDQTANTHDTQTAQPVSYATSTTIDGRLSRHPSSIRNCSKSYTSRNVKQAYHNTSKRDSQTTTHIRATHPTEEAPLLGRLETSRKNHSQPTAAKYTSPSAASKTTHYAKPRASTFNKSARTNGQKPGASSKYNSTGLSNDSERHSSDEPAHNDHAEPVNVTDGGHPAKSVHFKHHEGHIPEHARHHDQVRILHWNAQGLNSSAKQSALVAAIELDHIDVVMIQDSRISANNEGKPPIRVPNCHTYFTPASAECHGLLTIVRNKLPSKIVPPIATSEGTELLTVKVWIDKKPTLLHNIYRVRGETSFTEILAGRLPSILAGDFNAHNTLWCRSTDGPGRTLLDQIENANTYAIMNKPQIPTTKYNTTIDLTIVHTSIAYISEWAIYDDLISDHHPIILTIQTDYTPPITVPTPRWCLHKADWDTFKVKLAELCTTTKLDCSIDEQAHKLTELLIQAAEHTIPKTKPHKKKRKYWCYKDEVKTAKWALNRAIKKLRNKKRTEYPNLEPYKQEVREANVKYRETCNNIRNKAWDDWLTENNTDLNSKTIWQRIKRCTGTQQHPPTHPNPLQESNRLLSEFVARSSSDQLQQEDVRILQQHKPIRKQQIQEAINSPSECDRPITVSEIDNVLKKVRDSTPGEDTISYSMLKNAPPVFLQQLADLFTRSLQSGRLVTCWKLATIVPIPKKNNAYRPISLLSVIGKVMEKIILHRIRWSANPPSVRATGFKPGSGTRDAISVLLHDISTSRTRRRRAAAVYLDLQKAFELVNKEVILSELITAGLHGRLIAWTSDFLADRRAKVRFQNCFSDLQSFENGTPQGSSLSPTLFNYAMNIFLRLQLPEGVRILAYADDLVIYCVDRQNIILRLQSALNILSTAASSNGFRFAPEKTMATWFYHANPDTKLQLYNQDINWADRVKYLGVNIDKQLNMHSQVSQTLNSVSRAINTIKIMSSLSGVNSKILLRTFNGCTRACLDYGAECFNLCTLTQMRQLQRKQNNGLRLVLGVNKWAPTSSIHAELRILPLALRVEVFQANMLNKFLLNQNHPLREHLSAELHSPRPRNDKHKLTWLSTICRSHLKLAPYIPGAEEVPTPPPWCQLPFKIAINNHLPPKHTTEPSVLYNLTVVTMADITQPRDHVYYTDGSVSGGRVSAAYTYMGHPTLIRLSDNASIMQAELTAIHAALLHAVQSPSRCVVFSDSKSGLQALLQHQPSDNINILRDIRDVASRMSTPPILAWIPSHIGIEGNETADRAARQALMKPNIDTHLPMNKARTRRNIKQTARDINMRH